MWWLRVAVFVIVAAVVLSGHRAVGAGVAELAIAAAALVGWWAGARLPEPWAGRSLFACLTVLTAVGRFAATSHHDTSVPALGIVGMLAAGVDLPLAGVLVAFLAGVLAVEIGAVTYADADLGTVVLTTYADDEAIIAALKAGARGYLTKNADRREISQALHGAAAGHTSRPR